MLSINDVAIDLVEKFNQEGNVYFRIIPYQQQYYDTNVLDFDEEQYVAGVIYELPMPRIENFYQTRIREFELNIKFPKDIEQQVMDVVSKSLRFKTNDLTYNLSNLIINNTELYDNDDGTKTPVLNGVIRIGVDVPVFITGQDLEYKIDGVKVDVIGGNDIYDKALLSSVEFGDNHSDVNTGAELSFSFALGGNNKINEIFESIVNRSYNKSFNFEIDYKVLKLTTDLVLRNGRINRVYNNQPLTFTAVFERALERSLIKINGHNIEALGFTTQEMVTPIPKNTEGSIKYNIGASSNVYTLVLSNDKSVILQDLLLEAKNRDGKKFTLDYNINGIDYSIDCKLFNLISTNSENPNAVFNITLMEGDFDDNDI